MEGSDHLVAFDGAFKMTLVNLTRHCQSDSDRQNPPITGHPLDVDFNYFDVSADDAVATASRQAQESATATIGLWTGWSVGLNLD